MKGVDQAIGHDSDLEARKELYNKSFKAFLSNPFFGGGEVGGHSMILDTLGSWGVIGIGAILLYFKRLYNAFIHKNRGKPYYFYLIYIFCAAIVLSCLNPNWWIEAVCFCLPIFVAYIDIATESECESE